MVRYSWLSLGLALTAEASVLSSAICSNSFYSQFLDLSTYSAATAYCSTFYPLAACTSTSTTVVATTVETVAATSTVIIATSTVTVQSTIQLSSVTSTYTTLSTSVLTTTTTATTETDTIRSGTTTYSLYGPTDTAALKMKRALPSKSLSSLLVKAKDQSAATRHTICECIETPSCHHTTTKTVTSTHVGSTTSSAQVTSVRTISVITTTTVYAVATSVIEVDATSTEVDITVITTTRPAAYAESCPAACPGYGHYYACGGTRGEEYAVWCDQVITDINAGSQQVINAYSPGHCQSLCDSDDSCGAFSYDPTASLECTLYENVLDAPESVSLVGGMWGTVYEESLR